MPVEQKYKLNNLPSETTYTRFYLDFTGKKRKDKSENPFTGLTKTQQFIMSIIAAKPGRKLTYDYIHAHYGIWRGAIKPALDDLESRGFIKKLGASRYEIIVEYQKNYLKIDDYLFQKLEFENLKTGETVYKKHPKNALQIIGLVTRGNRNKKTGGVFVSSQVRIATALNMANSTAGDTVRTLALYGIMTAEKADEKHDKNKHGLTAYKIAPEVLAVKHVKNKKAKEPARPKFTKPTTPPQHLPEEPTQDKGSALRAAIERHYFDLRHKAEDRAAIAHERALRDERYNALHKKIQKLVIERSLAEVRGNSSEELTKRLAELEERADKRLTALGINKADFEPKYTCPTCKDTGYDSGGNPCTCLKKFIKSL